MIERIRRARGDSGFTLVELLVTVLLMALVLSLVTGMVQSSRGVLVTERARTTDLGVAFPAMDQVQRSVRAIATPASGDAAVISASATSLTYYTLAGTSPQPAPTASVTARASAQPRKVTLALDTATDTLRMTTVPATLDSSTGTWLYTGAGQTRVLATGVVNDGATPLLRYLDSAGNSVTGPLSTPADRDRIAFVEVRLVLDTNNGAGAPVEVLDTIRLANHGNGS